jgi:hypothetical protein
MNTQLNNTPDITLANLNANVLQLVSDLVMEALNKDEEHVQWP